MAIRDICIYSRLMELIWEEIDLKMILAIAAIALIMGFAQAAAITVCPDGCDYKSIQSAEYAAKPGDTIEVHSGTYNESVKLTKNINFKGIDTGEGEPIVNGGLYKNGYDSSLRGFSFQEVISGLQWSYLMTNQNTTLYLIENASEVGTKSPTKGLAMINQVLKTNPNDANAWFIKGRILSDSQRYEDSIDAFNESIKIDPYYYAPLNWIGFTLYTLKKYNESLQYYDEAIVLSPSNGNIWDNKGNSLYKLGKYDEALTAYEKAIEFAPDSGLYWSHKSDALEALGQTDDADEAYAKAEELGYIG